MKKLIVVFTTGLLLLIILFFPCLQGNTFQEKDSSTREKYAVIIIGRYAGLWKHLLPSNFQQYYTWYLNAAGMTYTMLTETYGYQDEHIFLLVSLRNRFTIPHSFQPDWIDYTSTKDNLESVLNQFKPGGSHWASAEDSLLFVVIDHGIDDESTNGKYAHNTFFGLPYEYDSLREFIRFLSSKNREQFRVYDWELAEYVENIHAGKKIFLMQPCHSGGFINELSGINHIVCTSSREQELATASWIEPFIQGLQGKADANGDFKVSLLEAYEYTARKVQEKTSAEHPLLDDNDDGRGHHFTEVGYNPTEPNNDGYVAARTYL